MCDSRISFSQHEQMSAVAHKTVAAALGSGTATATHAKELAMTGIRGKNNASRSVIANEDVSHGHTIGSYRTPISEEDRSFRAEAFAHSRITDDQDVRVTSDRNLSL